MPHTPGNIERCAGSPESSGISSAESEHMAMTPQDIRKRREELGLTVDEMAFALNMTEAELMAVEAGESQQHLTPRFIDAFEAFEERVFGTYVGA